MKTGMRVRALGLGCAGALLMLAGVATAATYTASGTAVGPNGEALSGEAIYTLTGTTLTIQLINNGAAVQNPSDVLAALFFRLPSGVTMSPVSAALGSGATVSYGSIINNVGEGWSYGSGFTANGDNAGVSASGLGLFGAPNFYSTPVTPLNGINYGIANGFNNPNAGVTGHGPLISSEVDLTLNVTGTLDLSTLGGSSVFQWGTALTEPNSVPDGGATVALLGLGLLGIGFLRRHFVSL